MTIESPQLFTDADEVDESNQNSMDVPATVVEEQQRSSVNVMASEASKPDAVTATSDSTDSAKSDTGTSPLPQSSKSKKPLSKAARIRKHMVANPSATNIEIVEKLGEFGVKYPDVAGVRGLMKRKEAESNARVKVAKTASPETKSEIDPKPFRGKPKKVVKTSAKPVKNTAKVSGKSHLSEINLADLETGLSFIEQVSGVENARRIIDLVARIRRASID